MITRERAHALINEHAELRKLAFVKSDRALAPYFQAAKDALSTIKTASASASFDQTLLRHLIEP